MALLAHKGGGVRRYAIDAVVVAVLMVAAWRVGEGYVGTLVAQGFQPEFYQNEFGAAVSLACGRGYQNPDASQTPSLDAFLSRRIDQFSCADLPIDMRTSTLTGPQATWKYMLWAAAATWRVSGEVSWSALQHLSGIMLALTAAASFVAFRLAGGAVVAAIGTVLVMTSPLHLRHLPHLRDYSKAPFMILIGVLLALLLLRTLSTRMLAVLALAFGIVLGVGAGFRNDLLIAVPPFVIAVIVAAVRSDRGRFLRMAAALTAGALGFLVSASPMLGAYATGGGASMPHVALLGLAAPFDAAMRVERSPVYGFGYAYSDSQVAAVVSDTAFRIQGHHDRIRTYDSAYDRASSLLISSVATTLPADLWVRGLASILTVTQLPSVTVEDTEPPPGLEGTWQQHAYEWRAARFRHRTLLMQGLVLAAFLVGALISPITAGALLFLAAYFSGYPAVQFHERHYFHLNIVPLLAAAFLVDSGIRFLSRWRRGEWLSRAQVMHSIRGCAVVAGAAAVVIAGPLAPLRAYQGAQVRQLVDDLERQQRETIAHTDRADGSGSTIIDVAELPAQLRSMQNPGTVQSEVIVAEFRAGCAPNGVSLEVEYDATASVAEFSHRTIQAPSDPAGPTRLFFPVYYYLGVEVQPSRYAFHALKLEPAMSGCVASLARLSSTVLSPLQLDLKVWPGWQSAPLHQSLQDQIIH